VALTLLKQRMSFAIVVEGDGASLSIDIDLSTLYDYAQSVPRGATVSQPPGSSWIGSPGSPWDNSYISGDTLHLEFASAFTGERQVNFDLFVDKQIQH